MGKPKFLSWSSEICFVDVSWHRTSARLMSVRLSVPNKMSHSCFVALFFHAASWIIHHWKGIAKYYKTVKSFKILRKEFLIRKNVFSINVTGCHTCVVWFHFSRSKLRNTWCITQLATKQFKISLKNFLKKCSI